MSSFWHLATLACIHMCIHLCLPLGRLDMYVDSQSIFCYKNNTDSYSTANQILLMQP